MAEPKPTISEVLFFLRDELEWKKENKSLEYDKCMIEAYERDIACLEFVIRAVESLKEN